VDEQTGTPDAPPADSSSAPLDPSTALANASPEEYATWQKTGSLPVPEKTDDTSKPAEIDAAKPAEQATSTDVKGKAASEPAAKDKTEQRFQELLADRAKERERANKLERELAALRATPPADVKAESSPAPATDSKPNADDATKYPDGVYDRQYFEDLADWKARQVLRSERETAAQAAKREQAEAREHERGRLWFERVTAARAKDPNYDSKAFSGPTPWNEGSPIDVWIMDSPAGADLLPHLMANQDEARRIDALPVVQQLRELVLLETKLQPAPAKTITDAPAPPRTLGDRTTANADAVAQALRNKDFGAFNDEMNRRELASRRG
jgi:hypothetical protein